MTGNSNEKENDRRGFAAFVWRNIPRLLLFLSFVLIIFLAVTCSRQKTLLEEKKLQATVKEKKPINVVLLQLEPTTIRDAINLPGIVEAWTQLELMAKLSGSVVDVLVQEGDRVAKGDVLARIEADDYRIAYESTSATYRLAKIDYERDKEMFAKKVKSQAELERSRTHMQTAKAAMENARLQLDRCSITAPMDGVVNRLDAKVGLLLSVADPVAQILAIDRVKAVVGIPESDIAAVSGIDKVTLTIKALNDRRVVGKAYYLSSAPETAARLYRFELALDNTKDDILPGMFVRADIIKKSVHDGVAVPLYAVITRNDEQYVYVAVGDTVEKRPVELGIIDGWRVQVVKGLSAGERVVIEGHREVDVGQKINVIREVSNPENILP